MQKAFSLTHEIRFIAVFVMMATVAAIYFSPSITYALSQLPSAEGTEGVEAAPEASAEDDAPTAEEGVVEQDGGTLVEKVAPLIEKLVGAEGTETSHDVAALPEPVARMRELIFKAAVAGDLKATAMLMNPGPDQTSIGLDDSGNDLETALKDMSGDEKGMEILAIMADILSTGYAHVGQGTPDEVYVWPYFVRSDINTLTPAEEVELMRVVTAGDYVGMLEFGGYNFYRIGITPDGRWRFFLAGD